MTDIVNRLRSLAARLGELENEHADEGWISEIIDVEEAAAEITALRARAELAERQMSEFAERCQQDIEHHKARAEAAEKRVAELEAVLRPFAEAWSKVGDGPKYGLTSVDWRAAAAALAKGGAG